MNLLTKEFKAKIQPYINERKCYICGASVKLGQEYHGPSGAHFKCWLGKGEHLELPAKMRAKRTKDVTAIGYGRVANTAIQAAKRQIESILGAVLVITDSFVNAAGRESKNDKPCWGFSFSCSLNGKQFNGKAVSKFTMTSTQKSKVKKISDCLFEVHPL